MTKQALLHALLAELYIVGVVSIINYGVTRAEHGGKVFLYHSRDDEVVPFVNLNKYKSALPEAGVREFANRGHFNQEEFPELVDDIKGVCQK